jgi:uncharacterized membrane protein (UPF0127 family)
MAKPKVSLVSTYSLLVAFLVTGGLFAGYAYWYEPKVESAVSVTASSFSATGQRVFTKDDPWPLIYPNTKSMSVAEVKVRASVAETWPERIRGLSNTPYLPLDVVKLFIFDSPGFHSIWMKDMNYSIDILWVDEDLSIVYIEEAVTPETYPNLFVPTSPAKYVIETASGFVAQHQVSIGQVITLP